MKLVTSVSGWMRIAGVAVCLACLVGGCGRSAEWADRREEQDPLLKRARVKKRAQDIDGAIALYRKALDRKPDLGRAHLEIALLYDGFKEDYLRAIYHYKRYLELRPDTEKKGLIEDLIRAARLSFAASLPDTPSGAVEEIKQLREENGVLRRRVEDLQQKLKTATAEATRKTTAGRAPEAREERVAARPRETTAAAPTPVATPTPDPAEPAMQIYRVQRGDTLSSIAAKMYNDPSKWRKIYEANRTTLAKPESIRVGQTLRIPRDG